jgi:hypothetical protein
MLGKLLRPFALGLAIAGSSCASLPPPSAPLASRPQISNPIFVASNNRELVTERAADVLATYNFEPDTAYPIEGTIATRYRVGSSVLEPWNRDSVGASNRLESTCQSIRRKVLIHYVPVEGGYLVSVEAFKELEQPTSPSPATTGGSTFIVEHQTLQRDLNVVLGQASPPGWLPLGRDFALEQDMLCQLEAAYRR